MIRALQQFNQQRKERQEPINPDWHRHQLRPPHFRDGGQREKNGWNGHLRFSQRCLACGALDQGVWPIDLDYGEACRNLKDPTRYSLQVLAQTEIRGKKKKNNSLWSQQPQFGVIAWQHIITLAKINCVLEEALSCRCDQSFCTSNSAVNIARQRLRASYCEKVPRSGNRKGAIAQTAHCNGHTIS